MATPTRPDASAPPAVALPSGAAAAAPAAIPEIEELSLSGLLSAGMRTAWACRRPLVFVLAANLILAAGVVYPLLGPMDASLSFHPEADRIGRTLDARWWGDWTYEASALVEQTKRLVGAAGFIMVIAGAFFAGGMLEALRDGPRHLLAFEPLPDPHYRGATPQWRSSAPGPTALSAFLKNSARHFPRFLFFLALSMPFYLITHLLLNRLAVIGLDRLLEGVEDERLALALKGGRAALFVAAFYLVTVVFEYVRAHEVLKPGATLSALLSLPARLLRARPGLICGIEAAALILHVAALLAFIPLDRVLSGRPALAATAGLLATQAFLFLRLMIRTGIQGAQIRLARSVLRA